MEFEELDYMSEEFVTSCSKIDNQRSGLIKSHSVQRLHNIEKKKKLKDEENKIKNVSKKVVEAERLQEGLKEALDSGNKGFSLLQKMGYQPGTGIGKFGSGVVNPISVTLKRNREGLGCESAKKQKQAQKEQIFSNLKRARESLATDFQKRTSKRYAEKYIELDLNKSQKLCMKFDMDQGCNEPSEWWFWPELNEDDDDDEDEISKDNTGDNMVDADENNYEENILSASEKLQTLTQYLRTTYFYCIWCCTQYDNEEDINLECPGATRLDH